MQLRPQGLLLDDIQNGGSSGPSIAGQTSLHKSLSPQKEKSRIAIKPTFLSIKPNKCYFKYASFGGQKIREERKICLKIRLFGWTYTKHGPGSMDYPMDPVHGPPHGPGPWTTPNFQKEIAPVSMKIYHRSGYEKHRLVFFHQYTLITNLFS